MSQARNKKGKLETWHLVSNLKLRAEPMAKEYGFRFYCEEGFRLRRRNSIWKLLYQMCPDIRI